MVAFVVLPAVCVRVCVSMKHDDAPLSRVSCASSCNCFQYNSVCVCSMLSLGSEEGLLGVGCGTLASSSIHGMPCCQFYYGRL